MVNFDGETITFTLLLNKSPSTNLALEHRSSTRDLTTQHAIRLSDFNLDSLSALHYSSSKPKPRILTADLLLLIKKNTYFSIERTIGNSQETLEIKRNSSKPTFTFDTPQSLKEDKWLF